MALTQTWALRSTTTDTTIDSTDSLAFSDGTFGNAITVNAYNGGSHVRSSAGANDSSAVTTRNVKYIASGTADWGDGTESLTDITDAECTLKLTIAYDTEITVTDISLYGYDGTTDATGPVGMTVQLAEQGDAAWTTTTGNDGVLAIADSDTPATSHDFFVAVSASPTSVGVKSANRLKVTFTYQ